MRVQFLLLPALLVSAYGDEISLQVASDDDVEKLVVHHLVRRRLYDLGEDVTLCWATPINGSSAREDCSGAEVVYEDPPPSGMVQGDAYEVSYQMLVPIPRSPTPTIPHANIHSCERNVGFCTPFVANTPGLSTHSTALTGTLTTVGTTESTSFTSEVQLDAGQYTIIAHCRWYDTSGAQHNMARAVMRDVAPPFNVLVYVSIGLGAFVFLIFVAMAVYFVRTHVRRYRMLEQKAEAAFRARSARVRSACEHSSKLAFPMCCVSYSDFKAHGKIVSYEKARKLHQHTVFDTAEDVRDAIRGGAGEKHTIAFVSHQWKGVRIAHPDPTNSDFAAVTRGVDSLVQTKGLDESKLLIWIDFTSIPQRNEALQRLSIASLPVYASFASFFLVSAPPTVNPDTGVLYDLAAWESRGWCRLEQWARITQHGVDEMYVLDGGETPRSVSEDFEMLAKSMHVYDAEFTVDDDKLALVDTSIALFHLLLSKETKGELDGLGKRLLEKAVELKDVVYPASLFDDLIFITESITKNGVAERRAIGREVTTHQSFTKAKSSSKVAKQTTPVAAKGEPPYVV